MMRRAKKNSTSKPFCRVPHMVTKLMVVGQNRFAFNHCHYQENQAGKSFQGKYSEYSLYQNENLYLISILELKRAYHVVEHLPRRTYYYKAFHLGCCSSPRSTTDLFANKNILRFL